MAVRVTTHQGTEHTFPRGHSLAIRDAHLLIKDVKDVIVAVYPPGAYVAAEIEPYADRG